jgi:hypothetical protein
MYKPVYAHVLKTDGNIGVVLHINPNDEPLANQPSNLVFEFKDKQKAFRAKDCDCIFSVQTNGKTIYSQPLFQNTEEKDTYAAILYMFPESNIYHIQLSGKPISNTGFKPFRISWDVRVAPAKDTGDTTQLTSNIPSPSLILFTIFLVGGIILFVRNKVTKNT